ncbi:NAD(P)-binding domain-containing protein [Amycolatopsis sp. PS_44_ISF1]|uniref:NADPH-dependent F420 reductase n=1 Tax=Amycolatopsis sp. PS_44_ISF1 TaxID=2974917 RepID=UPI0028DFADE9|nr:NAD(P)-binding domain-containing protein [Amycolatopsis sp. PS_44_ISF1]MDT8912335.1 NAD(P)-binding domain-containing protein [Amycolatopsis sp. PS_44_ISF1]
MATIGILGAGEVGSQLARAAVAHGHDVVLANSRGPETLTALVDELGPSARAAPVAEAAAAADFAIIAFPYRPDDDLPVDELAGKIVLDTNNYMAWRDGHHPVVDSGEQTEHELRQAQLPKSKLAKAFTHLQAPNLFRLAKNADDPARLALAVSSNHPEAVELVTRLYDAFGFDTVDNSPLSESWRSAPGTVMWQFHDTGQRREDLVRNLARARPGTRP